MFKSIRFLYLSVMSVTCVIANPDQPSTSSQKPIRQSIWEAARTGNLEDLMHWCIHHPELLLRVEPREPLQGLGYTPLFNAVAHNQTEAVKFLLQGGFVTNLDQKTGPREMTPLAYAALVGNVKMVENLHSYGASLDVYVKAGFRNAHMHVNDIATGEAKDYLDYLSSRNPGNKKKKSHKNKR